MADYSIHNISTVELEDAFGKDHCPVCRVIRENIEKYLWNLFYAFTSDPETHQNFKKSLGLCSQHSQLAVKIIRAGTSLSGTSMALLYETTIPYYLKKLDKVGRPTFGLLNWLSSLWDKEISTSQEIFSKKPCPACRIEGQNRRMTISILADMLNKEEYRKLYQKSDGLCQPHFEALIKQFKTAKEGQLITSFLVSEQKDRLELLKRRLGELRRKKKHDVTEEVTKEEARSWEEAVWRFSGWEPPGLLTRE